jgi:hypothetical protein
MSADNSITMTQAQLDQVIASATAAAVAAALGQVASTTPTVTEAAAPAKGKATTTITWSNVTGYTCKREFTAFTSSNAVRRHLAGSCKCKKENESCTWVANGRLSPESFNSMPGITLVKDKAARTFSLADADGNAIEVDWDGILA